MKKATLGLNEVGDVLTREQLEQVLGIGTGKAQRLINSGQIRSIKLHPGRGGRRLIPKAAVQELLESAKTGL